MTIEKYEQMELDTRKDVEVMAASVTSDAIDTIGELAMQCAEKPTFVRNRHEAYGIAAEHLAKITERAKAIKSAEDLVAFAREEGIELTDEQLDAIAGGSWGNGGGSTVA